ncbi:hypothetical protein WMY93_021732 [Mugilogobius chulae]|uniref:Nuclear pore complex protein Nup214 phenylalanine-glycine (FG) domain-containing protein n=1 Tax=Mugilogobius chulae TaxID=88201 RepID=A0AAW0NBG7_9GOBI
MDQSGMAHSQFPNKSVSQILPPTSTISNIPTQSQTMPQINKQSKEEPKQSGGLFGFSLGEILTGPTETSTAETTSQEGSIGKSILSLFSVSDPPQAESKANQHLKSGASPQQPPQESIGKSLLSMFSAPSNSQPSPQAKSNVEVQQQKTIPAKEPPSTGFLSMFGMSSAPQPSPQANVEVQQQNTAMPKEPPSTGFLSMLSTPATPQPTPQTKSNEESQQKVPPKEPPSTGFLSLFGGPSVQQQQPQANTGSLLGGILSGSSGSGESPMKGLFSVFSDSTPQQTQKPAPHQANTPQQAQTGPYPQEQTAASVLGGLFGSLSNSSERKPLFSVFSSPDTQGVQQTNSVQVSSAPAVVITKAPATAQQQNSSLQPHVSVSDAPEKFTEMKNETSANSGEVQNSAPMMECHSGTKDSVNKAPIEGSATLTPSSTATVGSDTTANSTPSAPQPSPQVGGSLLGKMFGGATQTTAPQTGSLLGGLFGSPATQTGANQASPSVLGGLFSGTSPQTEGTPSSGSILGGIFGGSAAQSSSAPQSTGSILGGLFGTPTGTTSTASSLLGGILPASSVSSETSGKGLTSVIGDSVSQALPKPHDDKVSSMPVSETTSKVTSDVQISSQEQSTVDSDKLQPQVILSEHEKTESVADCPDLHKVTQPVDTLPKEPEQVTNSEASTDNKMPVKSDVGIQEQQKIPEPEKSVLDSSTDKVVGFVSSLFGPPPAPNNAPQQQAKTAPNQTGPSLLGGLFGGATAQPSTSQTGGSLLGGLFGSAPQSSPQSNASNLGGSVLGSMFGGPSTAKPGSAPPSGSILGGMFGGNASNASAQSGGSILGGMFSGVTAQNSATQPAASVLGGIGGSLFGGNAQQTKPPEKPAVKYLKRLLKLSKKAHCLNLPPLR